RLVEQGFLHIVPVAAIGIAANHLNVLRIADHDVGDAGWQHQHITGFDADACAIVAEEDDFHPAAGAAKAFMRGRMEMGIGIDAGIAPIVEPAMRAKEADHGVFAAAREGAALDEYGKSTIGQKAYRL